MVRMRDMKWLKKVWQVVVEVSGPLSLLLGLIVLFQQHQVGRKISNLFTEPSICSHQCIAQYIGYVLVFLGVLWFWIRIRRLEKNQKRLATAFLLSDLITLVNKEIVIAEESDSYPTDSSIYFDVADAVESLLSDCYESDFLYKFNADEVRKFGSEISRQEKLAKLSQMQAALTQAYVEYSDSDRLA